MFKSKTPTNKFRCKVCQTPHSSKWMRDICEQLCMKKLEFDEPKERRLTLINTRPK